MAARHVPDALILVAIVEPEASLLAPLRAVVSCCLVQRGPRCVQLIGAQYAIDQTQTIRRNVALGLIEIGREGS